MRSTMSTGGIGAVVLWALSLRPKLRSENVFLLRSLPREQVRHFGVWIVLLMRTMMFSRGREIC